MITITYEAEKSGIYYTCPACGEKGSFIGISAPISCSICNVMLPDIIDLKFDELTRKRYHLNEGFYNQCC